MLAQGGLGGAPGGPPGDAPQQDTSEQIYISSLALLKMLKHGRAGVPLEVMGLMLGEFVDDYTVKVVDVFAMPQSGTGVSVEAVDPVFQTKMLDMLKQVGRCVCCALLLLVFVWEGGKLWGCQIFSVLLFAHGTFPHIWSHMHFILLIWLTSCNADLKWW